MRKLIVCAIALGMLVVSSVANEKTWSDFVKDNFCNIGNVSGFESIQQTRENGECEAYLKRLIETADLQKKGDE